MLESARPFRDFSAEKEPPPVSLWHASLDRIAGESAGLAEILDADEKTRAERFVFERDKSRYIAGRAVLRMILGRCLDRPPREVAFRYETHGKPLVEGTDLTFNMSKSAGRALYAVTRRRRIGVDLEKIRDITEMDLIARRFFCRAEIERLGVLEGDLKRKAFFEYWTRKEALVKADGAGLTMPLPQLDVSADPDEPVRLVRIEGDLGIARQWTIRDVMPDPEFAAAVAIEGPYALPLRTRIFPSSGEDDGNT
jgi:4'-phosphopantetheinyl transferase